MNREPEPGDARRPAASLVQSVTLTGEHGAPVPSRPIAGLPFPGAKLRDPERYQIIGEHGRGGLGRVSRAHDHDLGRDIAIKELISRGPLSEIRFLREALITARLEHPGIVPVHEAGRWPDGTPFYAMKLVAGRSLRELLAERVTVAERIGLLHHVIAVADAIAYAHRRHIIHRDLKPANVIVGDFGETVVIDWGLAKDLSAPDEAGSGEGRPAGDHRDGLTSTGLVLGTPAYMAPEQARGERVDQRADVFALGAMLWELCALDRLQAADRPQRRRALRRSRVDRDLVAIIEKAIDPDPACRYPDAGALAADLKAFKAGARIAARSYSVVAVLGHWARRHRALAVSVGAAAIVALSVTALYVRNVAIARDRAEASNDRLVLQQAELMLHSDPSAALDLLDGYRGGDAQQLNMLRARARGLGLARLRAQPHTQVIYFAHAFADGTLLTLAGDGTVAKTAPDGRSRVIARGVAPQYTVAYSAPRHLLAYACNATGICLLDVETEAPVALPSDRPALAPTCLSFSPDAALLAALSPRGELAVWQLGDGPPAQRYTAKFDDGEALRFADDETLAIETEEGIHLVHLPLAGHPAPPAGLAMDGVEHVTTNPRLHLVAVTTSHGSLVVIDARADRQLLTEPICRGPANRLLVLAEPPAVVYACQDGDAGILDLSRRTPSVLTHLDGGATSLAATDDGRMLIIGGARGQLAIYDASTGMVSARLGHSARISVLLPPSAGFPYIVSGDESGALRAWSPPEPTVRVAARTETRMLQAAPLPGHGPVIAIGIAPTIPWDGLDGSAGELEGHITPHVQLALSPARPRFALYGSDEDIELWSLEAGAMHRTLRSPHGAVTGVAFASAGDHLLVGHRDGTIAQWASPDAAPRDLGSIHEAVAIVRACPRGDVAVVAGAGGTLWLARETGLVQLATQPEPITSLACARDGGRLVVGTAGGAVRLYDVATRRPVAAFAAASWIEFVEFSADSRSIAFSSHGRLRVVAIDSAREVLALPAHHAAFSPDNTWFAAIGDRGDLWFHRAADDHWVYLATGAAKVAPAFSDDGRYFVATDPGGRALVVDMASPALQ